MNLTAKTRTHSANLLLMLAVVGCAASRELSAPPSSSGSTAGSSLSAAEPPPAHRLPDRVYVKPVFLVPTDASTPSEESKRLFMRHIEWTRQRYRQMLFDRDTFTLAEGDLPLVLHSRHDIKHYLATTDGGAEDALLELFEHDGVDRFSCPSIYVILFVGTGETPKGGGRPINGYVNTGGGVVVMAADNLQKDDAFQSCLQHEIGHAFGLVHADANGLDMATCESLMSYNPNHHTHGFEPSPTPGRLVPEDLRMLSFNKRVFPHFTLDAAHDFPPDYPINPTVILLGPMSLRGQPDYEGTWNGE